MNDLFWSPRKVFLPAPVDEALAEAIRAAGHAVESGSREAFERSDTVVVTAPPSTSGLFFAGAATATRRLTLLLSEHGAEGGPVTDVAHAVAGSVPELVELLRRWDPLNKGFMPRPRPPRRYRHRETGEVRQRAPSAIGGSLKLRVLDGTPYLPDVVLRDGEHEASGWELLEERSGQ